MVLFAAGHVTAERVASEEVSSFEVTALTSARRVANASATYIVNAMKLKNVARDDLSKPGRGMNAPE